MKHIFGLERTFGSCAMCRTLYLDGLKLMSNGFP